MTYKFSGFAVDVETLLLLALGVGVLIVFLRVYMTSMARDPVADRMRATAQSYVKSSDRKALLKTPHKIPEGLLKALIPEDRSKRTMIRFRLWQAGFDGPNFVRNFFVLRLASCVGHACAIHRAADFFCARIYECALLRKRIP
jgi:hypothetical protein